MIFGDERQRAGDGDALALAAGKFVRVAAHLLRRQPDAAEQRGDAVLDLAAARDAVDDERLADELADRHARVERGVGVLEHHLDVAADRASSRPAPRPRVSWPATRMPPSARTRPSSALPVVDLPQPDSPTSASVSPAARSERDALDGMDARDLALQDAALDVEADGEVARPPAPAPPRPRRRACAKRRRRPAIAPSRGTAASSMRV